MNTNDIIEKCARSEPFIQGRRNGVKSAIEWLHARANSMNDPHAKAILNSAAANLGWDFKHCSLKSSLPAEVLNLDLDAASELEQLFDLRHAADMRAIERWQKHTGQSHVLPDHADLCVWLLEQLEATKTSEGGDANEPATPPGLDKSSPGVTAGARPAETVSDAMVEQAREIVAENSGCSSFRCFHDDECACRDVSRQILALAPADDGWRPIESGVPKDGTTILVSFGTRGVHAVGWCEPSGFDHEIWCVDDGKHGPYALRGWNEKPSPTAPTHWRPLPAPPKDGRE